MRLLLILFTVISFSAFSQQNAVKVPFSFVVDTFTVHISSGDTVVFIGSKAQGIIPIQSYIVNTDGSFSNNNTELNFTPDTVIYNKIIDCANLQNSYEGGNTVYPLLHYSSDMALHSYGGTAQGIILRMHPISGKTPSFYVIYGAK